jgi:hypothetical protein
VTDFANLVLAVDATSVTAGAEALDRLAASGARASGVGAGVANSTRSAGVAAARMATDAQAASVATVRAAAGVTAFGSTSKIAAHNLANLSYQLNDVVSGLAMGQAPMQILTQQGGQFYQIMQQSGMGARGFAAALLEMTGVLKVTRDAELAEIAANAAASAAAISSAAQRSAAAIAAADTELALAEAQLRVATTAEAEAAAQLRLSRAHQAVAAASADAAITENALARAQTRSAEAAAASQARTVTTLGRVGIALTAVGAIATVAYAGINSFQREVAKSGELDKYAASLRLTDEQIRKAGGSVEYLADGTRKVSGLGVSMGNILQATFQVIAERAGITGETIQSAFGKAFRWLGDFGKFTISVLLAGFAGLITLIMSVGANLGRLATGNFDALTNPIQDVKEQFKKTFDDVNAGFDAIGKRAVELEKNDLAQIAAGNKPPKAKGSKDKKGSDSGLADALRDLEMQIRAQEKLAAAYLESDEAVIRAEALIRAEEAAIRHKGDVALFYEKELRLAINQRITDGARMISDNRAQATALGVVNDLVEQGIIPVQRLSAELEEHSKKRQLFAALEAAQFAGMSEKAAEIEAEIAKLSKSQNDLNNELAREATLRAKGQKDDEIERLKLEVKLIGASNRERAVRLAQLEAENYIRDNKVTDPDQKQTILDAYRDAALGAEILAEAQNAYNVELSHTLEMLNLMVEQTELVGGLLQTAFGSAGGAIGSLLSNLVAWQAKEQEIADWKREETKKAGDDAKTLANIEMQAQSKSKNAQIQAIGSLLGAAKGLFKEHSAGYKAMEAAEKAFAIVQAISTIKSVAAGAAKMFSQLGVWAFPAVAAMIAVMAGLGYAGAKASGAETPPDIPTAGTGTVLGSPNAQSESIANSLALMSKNSAKGIDQGADMVRSLRSIKDGIGALTTAVARSLNLTGGFFDTTGQLGTKTSGIKGLFGSTTTTSLYDQGITIDSASLAQILENGITGSTYQVIEKIKESSGFLGIGGGTKTTYSTSTGALDAGISAQFQLVIEDIANSIVEAGKLLGYDVAEALKTFQVEIGQISFKDMSADEIEATLEAVFSKVADQMAGFAIEGLEQFQKAGEGLYETLMRVAKNFVTVGQALKSIGLIAPASIAAREALVELAGGLDELVSQINFYYENFLTDAQQLAFLESQVAAAFTTMGLAVPQTIEEFNALVSSLDLNTEAGQALFAQLMAIAPVFYELETAAEQTAAAAAAAAAALAKQKTQLQIDLLNAQGKAAEALALKRKMELEAMDASLRGLQQQVWAAQDLAKAKDNLLTAYKRESGELQNTIDKFKGFSEGLREFRDSLLDTGQGGNSLQRSLIKLLEQSGLANAGDEGALGGGLTAAAQTYLEQATANAGSLQDVARARALVMRSLDSAIGVSDGKASIAQQQLDQMKTQVGALIDINESVLSVAQAIIELKKLMPGAPGTGTGGGGTGGGTGGGGSGPGRNPRDKEERAHRERVERSLDSVTAATEQIAVNTGRVSRTLRNADRGGGLAVVTDPDSPLDTSGVELA